MLVSVWTTQRACSCLSTERARESQRGLDVPGPGSFLWRPASPPGVKENSNPPRLLWRRGEREWPSKDSQSTGEKGSGGFPKSWSMRKTRRPEQSPGGGGGGVAAECIAMRADIFHTSCSPSILDVQSQILFILKTMHNISYLREFGVVNSPWMHESSNQTWVTAEGETLSFPPWTSPFASEFEASEWDEPHSLTALTALLYSFCSPNKTFF